MKEDLELTTKVVSRIGLISPDEWNAVFPDVLEGYNFFKAIDESDIEGVRFHYIMVYRKGAPVGAAPCFLINYPLDTTIDGPFKKFIEKFKRFFPNFLNLKILICGCLTCEGRVGLTDRDSTRAVKAILNCMEVIAKDEKAPALAFKDFLPEYTKKLDPLLKEDFCKLNGYPSVEMGIGFNSIDEYLKGLSRATRKDLKRKFKKVKSLVKIDLEVSDNVDDFLDEVYELYQQTFTKSDIKFENMPKDFFRNISKNMRHNTKYFLWRIDKRLVAFNLCLVSKDVLIDEGIGMDYSVAYKYHLYFITFRDIINWCIENGIKRYETSGLGYEPKRRLGFRFVPTCIYVKHRNKLINPFFKFLCSFLEPENFDPILKEMKRKNRL